MHFSVIGGDMRQVSLAEKLAQDGHKVTVFALDKIRIDDMITHCETAKAATADADYVVLPLPAASREGMFNSPLSTGLHTMREILSVIEPKQIVFAGRIDDATYESARSLGLRLFDYLNREELAVANASITAEGAIQLIMEETPFSVSGARMLIAGYGRIGRALAGKLHALGADVTVSARKYSDLAWTKVNGFGSIKTSEIEKHVSEFDVVVNTVPSRIITEHCLKRAKKGSLFLDLASKPGGVDFAAASKLGVKAVWALSLPGEVAPDTSGENIKNTIYNMISEMEAGNE